MFEYTINKSAYTILSDDTKRKSEVHKYFVIDHVISKKYETKFISDSTMNKVERLLNEIPGGLITSEIKNQVYVQFNKTVIDINIPLKIHLHNVLKSLGHLDLLVYFPKEDIKKL